MAYKGAFSKHAFLALIFSLIAMPVMAQAAKHTQIPMSLKDKMAFVGTYKLSTEKTMTIALVGGQLQAAVEGQTGSYIYPESPTQFYYQSSDIQITFVPGPGGKAKGLTLKQGTRNVPGTRIGK